MSELQKGWTRVSLGEIVQPRKEKANPQKLGDLPFIGLEHVEAHSSRLLGTSRASDVKSAVVIFKADDVLYGRLRPYLNKVIQPDFAGCASAEFIVFPGSTAIDLAFLRRVLSQPRFVGFASHINQGDRPRVDFEQISTFEFGLPPLAEQRRIVAKLDSLFARTHRAREELARIPTLIKHYKEAILAAAFRGELTDKVDPAKWQLVPLFQVADIQLGKMLDKAKNRGTPKRYLRNINVRWRYFDLSDLLEMPFTESELVKFSINDGDILVCEGGEPGRAAVWRSGKTNLKYQKALHRVRVKDNVIPEWIVYQIEYLAKSGDLEKYFTGTTIKHLPREALSKASFVVPAIEDQQNILALW